jgi:hypothetical protein
MGVWAGARSSDAGWTQRHGGFAQGKWSHGPPKNEKAFLRWRLSKIRITMRTTLSTAGSRHTDKIASMFTRVWFLVEAEDE